MNELDRIAFQIITFGEKAKEMLDMPYIDRYFSLEGCSGKDLVLVVTDDAADYEAEITQTLSAVKNGSPSYLVLDLNAENDADKFRSLWQYYNKVKEAQTVKDVVDMMLQHLVWQNGIVPFTIDELLDTCSQGEYVGSIYVEKGLAGLKDVDAPSNAQALAVGVGFSFAHHVSMAQMDDLNEYFKRFGENVAIKWGYSCSISDKDNVIIVYSYNK